MLFCQRHFLYVILFLCYLFNNVTDLLAGAVDIGGGGDTVYCKSDGATSEFAGYYPLDYVVIHVNPKASKSIVQIEDSQHMERIQQNLAILSPLLKNSFDQFMDLYLNTDFSKPMVWQASKYGLVELDDEMLNQRLPKNCYQTDQSGRPNIIQTVIREERRGMTVFKYDEKLMTELASRQAPYRSYILVHEWLRSFTKSALVIRDVNFLLHSKELDEAKSDTFERMLESMGLNLSGKDGVSARSIKINPWGADDIFIEDPSPFFPGDSYEIHVVNELNTPVDIVESGTNKLVGRIPSGVSQGTSLRISAAPTYLCARASQHKASCFGLSVLP